MFFTSDSFRHNMLVDLMLAAVSVWSGAIGLKCGSRLDVSMLTLMPFSLCFSCLVTEHWFAPASACSPREALVEFAESEISIAWSPMQDTGRRD